MTYYGPRLATHLADGRAEHRRRGLHDQHQGEPLDTRTPGPAEADVPDREAGVRSAQKTQVDPACIPVEIQLEKAAGAVGSIYGGLGRRGVCLTCPAARRTPPGT
jgi:hypothetical protein